MGVHELAPHELFDWADEAACIGIDPDVFFPERGASTGPAKAVCAGCPVLHECRTHGLRHERHGIWGGLSEPERRRLRRRLNIILSGDPS